MTTDSAKQSEEEQKNDLTFEEYLRIVEKAKVKIADNKIYPNLVRDEIRTYKNSLQESTAEFGEIQTIY